MIQTHWVKNCMERRKPGTNISFHLFPKNPELKQEWIKTMFSNNSEPLTHSTVYSKHFASEYFIQNPWSSQRILKPNAVPNISAVTSDLLETKHVKRMDIFPENIKKENEIANLQIRFEDHNGSKDQKNRLLGKSSRKKQKFNVGDFKESDISGKENYIKLVNLTMRKKNNEIKILKQKNKRFIQNIKNLHVLIDDLRNGDK